MLKLRIRIIGIMSFLLFMSICMAAQSIRWQLKPSDYSTISRFGPDMYQVVKAGKTGLIHSDGSVIIPVSYDQITGFYENKALVLVNESGKKRVLGVLTDRGDYTPFTGKYYTISGQSFYSDNMLSVEDANGQKGYLNERGIAKLGFDGKWSAIVPFTEGHAAVFSGKGNKDRKYHLIDKDGDEARFVIGVGSVYGGTNVYKGKALVWDENGKFYEFDVKSGRCTSTKKPTISNGQSDYLFCFPSISGRGIAPPFSSLPSGHTGLAPVVKDGLYGYSTANKEILPCQFVEASSFEDNMAIVNLQEKYGILRYEEGGTDFSLSVPQPHLEYTSGKSVKCSFVLEKTEACSLDNLEVTVSDNVNGESIYSTNTADLYTFVIKPDFPNRSYTINVVSDGLRLWSGQVSYTFKKKEEQHLRASLSISSNKADENDKVYVYATITNSGTEPVTAIVTMTGSSTFNPISRSVSVGAGSSTQVTSFFKVTHTVQNQYVEVKTSKGGHDRKNDLTLIQFYF